MADQIVFEIQITGSSFPTAPLTVTTEQLAGTYKDWVKKFGASNVLVKRVEKTIMGSAALAFILDEPKGAA